jgi:hypothetical protein
LRRALLFREKRRFGLLGTLAFLLRTLTFLLRTLTFLLRTLTFLLRTLTLLLHTYPCRLIFRHNKGLINGIVHQFDKRGLPVQIGHAKLKTR